MDNRKYMINISFHAVDEMGGIMDAITYLGPFDEVEIDFEKESIYLFSHNQRLHRTIVRKGDVVKTFGSE